MDDHAKQPAPVREHDHTLPYVETTDEAYADFTAQNFTVEKVEPGTIILRGPCPRCHAMIDIPVVDLVFRSTREILFWRRHTRSPEPRARVEPMMCTCEDEHPNRPDGLYGCGAYWTVTISAPAQ
jgi:hypothetical protein